MGVDANELSREDHPCGAKDPSRVNTSTISSSATATTGGASGTAGSAATTGLDTFGGSGGSSSSQSTGKSNAGVKMTAIGLGQTYGFAAVCAGLFAGFGLML
jgi:hypothetical protein